MSLHQYVPKLFPRRRARNAAHPGNHLIELIDVVKFYPTPLGPFPALNHIDLQVDAGEFVGIIGRSGSGKTTLINMLTGIDRPTSGEIYINGTALHHLNERQMAIWRGTNVGIVFQFFQLLPTLTCIENIMLPMDFCHLYTPAERYRRAMDLLEQVELADQATKIPTDMSGGQQQRAAIARALANDPPILVADEPTGNLDTYTAERVFELFQRLVSQGKTILMVSHDPDLTRRVSHTIHLVDGQIVPHGKPGEDELPDALPIAQLREHSTGPNTARERHTFSPAHSSLN